MPGKSKKGGGLETKKSAFYLRSGNTTPFKQMGSSPLKQGGLPKDFNIKGSPSTTPGYSTTKAAKHKQNFAKFQAQKQKGKQFVKNLKIKGDLVSKKPASTLQKVIKAFKNTPKQFAKQAGKFIGGKTLGVAGMMMAKSASADQPGTGTHGGKKQTKYNSKSGKYE